MEFILLYVKLHTVELMPNSGYFLKQSVHLSFLSWNFVNELKIVYTLENYEVVVLFGCIIFWRTELTCTQEQVFNVEIYFQIEISLKSSIS